jgi:hypothetical protein
MSQLVVKQDIMLVGVQQGLPSVAPVVSMIRVLGTRGCFELVVQPPAPVLTPSNYHSRCDKHSSPHKCTSSSDIPAWALTCP